MNKNTFLLILLVVLLVLVIWAFIYFDNISKKVSFRFDGLKNIDISQLSLSGIISQDETVQTTLTFDLVNDTPFALTITELQLQAADNSGNVLFDLPQTDNNANAIKIASNTIIPITLDVNLYLTTQAIAFFANVIDTKTQTINYKASFKVLGISMQIDGSTTYP